MTALDDEEMAGRPGVTPSELAQVSIRPKYNSCDYSGSVFIISSEGQILKLPIPTKSAQDPLNWSKWKQARAFLALYVFAGIEWSISLFLYGTSSMTVAFFIAAL